MRQIGKIGFQSQQPRELPVFSESERTAIRRLFVSMQTNYLSAFMSCMDDDRVQQVWENSWMLAIQGKDPAVVEAAFSHCFSTHRKPFTKADFEHAYKALIPKAEHQRNHEALALPKTTWAARRAMAAKHLEKARDAVG